MDILLKQRLVGAAVIVSLGVVIIPILLDGSGNRIIQEIPPRPERQSVPGEGVVKDMSIPSPPKRDEGEVVYSSEPVSIKSTSEVELLAKQKSAQEPSVTKQPESSKIEAVTTKAEGKSTGDRVRVPEVSTITSVKSKLSESASPQKLASWVVQVGSFTEESKAINLRDQIRSKGFAVFMEHFKNSQQNSMYRVRVGPVQNRSEAEMVLKQVREKIKLENGYVTQHP